MQVSLLYIILLAQENIDAIDNNWDYILTWGDENKNLSQAQKISTKKFFENIKYRAEKLSLFNIFSEHEDFNIKNCEFDEFVGWVCDVDSEIYEMTSCDN